MARGEALPGAEPAPPALASRLEAALASRGPGHVPRSRHRRADGGPRYTNRLLLERSPYLLQHAHNPVDWYPWGDEAFGRARALGRPVLLSIGYSTCHWCHVMEEESFDDPEIAELMNRSYVAIKVDREERPDVDAVYMAALHALGGRGGWPMTLWLTADREPFYAGSYFPPRDGARGIQTGFLTLLRRLRELWDADRGRIRHAGGALRAALQESLHVPAAVDVPGTQDLDRAFEALAAAFDARHGGLRGESKFPASLPLPFLLREHRRTGDARALAMARATLDAMRQGGLYDHVGGGFHRYSVDAAWSVPHFEKMLYDQAQLVAAYLEAWQVTGEEAFAWVARDVLDWLEREMTAPGGALYSALDADSEGVEGAYYVWTPEQVRAALGERLAPQALEVYGVTPRGNFGGGRSVLHRRAAVTALADLEEIRRRLREARAQRVRPHRDEKQIVAWNGLAIGALARAGLALDDPGLIARAAGAARALLRDGRPGGRLARYVMEGEPAGRGLLEDFAFLIAGLLDLFEASGEREWLEAAVALQAQLDARFFDEGAGGYYTLPSDGEALLVREKPASDDEIPSGNSVAALNLLRLHALTTEEAYRIRGEMTLRAFSERLRAAPTSLGTLLVALDYFVDAPTEILIVAPSSRDEAQPFLDVLRRTFLPNRILVVASGPELPALARAVPLLREKRALEGETTAYVCESRVCERPARTPALFREQILARRHAAQRAAAPGRP